MGVIDTSVVRLSVDEGKLVLEEDGIALRFTSADLREALCNLKDAVVVPVLPEPRPADVYERARQRVRKVPKSRRIPRRRFVQGVHGPKPKLLRASEGRVAPSEAREARPSVVLVAVGTIELVDQTPTPEVEKWLPLGLPPDVVGVTKQYVDAGLVAVEYESAPEAREARPPKSPVPPPPLPPLKPKPPAPPKPVSEAREARPAGGVRTQEDVELLADEMMRARYCPKGHDLEVVGLYVCRTGKPRRPECYACRRLREQNRKKNRNRSQQGNPDVAVVGGA